jgi:hypothetical protein
VTTCHTCDRAPSTSLDLGSTASAWRYGSRRSPADGTGSGRGIERKASSLSRRSPDLHLKQARGPHELSSSRTALVQSAHTYLNVNEPDSVKPIDIRLPSGKTRASGGVGSRRCRSLACHLAFPSTSRRLRLPPRYLVEVQLPALDMRLAGCGVPPVRLNRLHRSVGSHLSCEGYGESRPDLGAEC